MGCKRIPHYPNDLKKEIIQKLKDGITRSDIQKEYGISPSSLSRWICPPDKIIAKTETVRHHPIQPISEENIDVDLKCEIVKKALTGVNMSKILEDHNIDAETLSKCYRKWFTPDDKIVAKVMGEIQTVPEDNIDEDDSIDHEEEEDNGIDDKADDNDDDNDNNDNDNNDDDDDDDNEAGDDDDDADDDDDEEDADDNEDGDDLENRKKRD